MRAYMIYIEITTKRFIFSKLKSFFYSLIRFSTMASFTILTIFVGSFFMRADGLSNQFSAYYSYLWGGDHFSLNPQGTDVQLKMDPSSG